MGLKRETISYDDAKANIRGQMAVHATGSPKPAETGACHTIRMAGTVLRRAPRVPLGRQGCDEDQRESTAGHRSVHQAGSVSRAGPTGGAGTTEGVHRGVA